ncbi:MAG: hypothetical protein KBS95_00795 [Alistipes sp.]|nr:hypothetical protein [Candidatus Alistipes equi]
MNLVRFVPQLRLNQGLQPATSPTNLMNFSDEVLFVLILNRLKFVFTSLCGTMIGKEIDMRPVTKLENMPLPNENFSGMNTISMIV